MNITSFALPEPDRYIDAFRQPGGRSVTDIFDEINDDLRAERLRGFALRYGWIAAVLLVLVLGAVGGVELWRWWQGRLAAESALSFTRALHDAGTAGAPASPMAAPELENIVATAPDGYRTVARFRLAALRANAGDIKGALALWDEVAGDTAVDPDLRGLANLLWVQRQLDSGDPATLSARLDPLADPNSTWHALAQEAQAELAIRQDDRARAVPILTRLAADPLAPDNVRGRARLMLSVLDAAQAASK